MLVRLRAFAERVRGSLFFLPAVFIVGALALAWVTVRIDDTQQVRLADLPFILETTVASARAVLGTIAGATITVAGIVFSVTVVAVQLTSSQFSPRALRGYLRDRFQQVVIAIVIGTFTYALVLLAVTRSSNPEAPSKNLSVTVALGLGLLAVLAIVAFIDRGTRALQVSAIIRRVADETLELAAELHGGKAGRREPNPDEAFPDLAPVTVPAQQRGWIQQIDERKLFRAIPQGTLARLDVRIGEFVARGDPLLTVWTDRPPPTMEARVNRAMAMGTIRTMQQDVPFGLSQLVDIALRALSPGINDPTTAIEALVEIGAVLGEILPGELPRRVVPGPQGRKLFRPHDFDRAAYVKTGFSQIRQAAAGQPAVMETLIWQLGRLAELFAAHEQPLVVEPLRREARQAIIAMKRSNVLADDVAPIELLARRFGLVDPDDGLEARGGTDRERPGPTPAIHRAGGSGGAEPGPLPEAASRAAEAVADAETEPD